MTIKKKTVLLVLMRCIQNQVNKVVHHVLLEKQLTAQQNHQGFAWIARLVELVRVPQI